MQISESRQSGATIELTPAVIDAGIYAAKEHCLGEPLKHLVERICEAVIAELTYEGPGHVKHSGEIGEG